MILEFYVFQWKHEIFHYDSVLDVALICSLAQHSEIQLQWIACMEETFTLWCSIIIHEIVWHRPYP